MSDLEKLSGTPWHVEKMVRSEGDSRRHRSRCKHYEGKREGRCDWFFGRCRGAAHCAYYSEKVKIEEKIEEKAKEETKEAKTSKKTPEEHKPVVFVEPFDGICEIALDSIVLPSDISEPKEEKVKVVLDYYKKNGTFDVPVYVTCYGDKYMLLNRYLRYYVAKLLNFKTVPAEMCAREEYKQRNLLRKQGTLVWIKKEKQVGRVVSSTLKKVLIKLDSGEEKTYDICKCLQTESVRIL